MELEPRSWSTPSVSVSGSCQREVGPDPAERGDGIRRARIPGFGLGSPSTMARTMAVAAIFKKMAISDRVGVPTITCRRRKCLGSAWGSVVEGFTMGVQRPSKPDDLFEEVGPLGDLVLDGLVVERRRLAADLARVGVDVPGHEGGMTSSITWPRGRTGTSRSLVSRRSCPSRPSCPRDDGALCRAAHRGGHDAWRRTSSPALS